ncbi:hypothetical protein CDAR_562851 [Caerostris darwini]|uniref:Uncharacterized protein n=1 Tax=Caerostris darwini TaxID=1538125 RepID=A0AAV4X6U6_9ARAC|nr:hypothetical protein CDAR_562851 [Caerostris darwini]
MILMKLDVYLPIATFEPNEHGQGSDRISVKRPPPLQTLRASWRRQQNVAPTGDFLGEGGGGNPGRADTIGLMYGELHLR